MSKKLGIPTYVIGLTVVAYGTSSPELVISLQAALDHHTDIAIGNVVGSNISNILCVLGLTAVISPVVINKKVALDDVFFMLAATILLYALCLFKIINILTGGALLLVLVLYSGFVFYMANKQKDKAGASQADEVEEQMPIKLNMWTAIAVCAFGMAMLMVGSHFLIKGAVACATIFGVSEAAIGLTLIAFGGSVPELVTSLIAAIHKHSGIVLGNVIGSNVFNILGVLGVTGMVAPLPVESKFLLFDMPILLVVTFLLFVYMYFVPKITRMVGATMVTGYVAYIIVQYI